MQCYLSTCATIVLQCNNTKDDNVCRIENAGDKNDNAGSHLE